MWGQNLHRITSRTDLLTEGQPKMYEANEEVITTYRTIKQIQVEEYARAISDVITLLDKPVPG